MRKTMKFLLLSVLAATLSTSVFAENVAEVDGKGYATLKEAIDAANDNDTVTLLQSYSWSSTSLYLKKSLTIDLNGFELTLSGTSKTAYYFTVNEANKTLTVRNGSIVSKGAVLASSGADRSMVRLEDVQATQNGGCFVTATAENSGLEIIGCTIVADANQSAMLVNVNWGASCVIQDSTLDNSKCTNTGDQNGCPFAVFHDSSVTLNGSCNLMSANASKLIHNLSSTVTVETGAYNFNPNGTGFTIASGLTVSGPVNGIYTVAADAPTPPAEDAAAKIGNAEYASLNAALAAVKDGETIDVCDDCTLDAATVSVTKSFSIDLHEKTLTVPSFAGTLFEVTAAVALTISNGSVKAEGASKTVFIDLNCAGGTVRLEALTATVACADAYWIDDMTVGNATLAIENCEFRAIAGRSAALVRVKGSDQVSIVDSTLDNHLSSASGLNTAAAIATLSGDGGAIALSGDCRLYASADKAVIGTNWGSVSTGAGTYNFNPALLGNWKSSDGYEVTGPDSDGIYTVVKKAADAAAKVDDVPYASLAEALAHLTAGSTLTLLKDQATSETITLSVSCTIDLGGCKLSFSGSGAFIEAGSNNPTLTIKNGTLDMTDASTTYILNTCVSIPQNSPATIVVDGVTAKVRGGKLRSAFAVSDKDGSMTISNCIITELSTGETFATVGINGNGGTINIENTTIDASAVATYSSNFKRSAVMVNAADAVMNISGTEFVGKVYSAAACNGTINISGGSFPQGLDKGTGTFVVTGGTFGSDPTAYVDTTAYDVAENPAGTWTVSQPQTVVEAIRISVEAEEDVTVGSFAEAATYLNDNLVEEATLTLLQDIGGDASVAFENQFSVSCNLTLDLNGHTLCWDGLDPAFEVTRYVQFVVTDGTGGGVLTSSFDDVIGSYGQLTIAGGTIQGAVYAYEGEGSSLAITGGAFDVAVNTTFEGFISGGRFKVKPAAECFASGKTASAGMDADGYYTVVDKPTSYKIEIRDENGDLIGGSDSWGLKDACDAVKAAGEGGRTIKVTQDLGDIANISGYDFGCSVTIDLGGHAFRNTSSASAYMFTPGTAGKTLAIVNGHVTFSNNDCYGLAQVSAGTFVASNITCTAGAQTSGKASIQVDGTGAAKIVDCTFDGEERWGSALYVASSNARGEIGGMTTVRCPNALKETQSGNWYAHAPVRVSGDGHVTINGGTYVGAKFALYVMSSGGHMTVNGGTFSGPVKCDLNTSTAGNPKSADITISDGDFTACSFVSRAGNHFYISGGTFHDNPETYDNVTIASGKEATKQGDVWVVGDKPAPAKKGTIILFGM